MGMNAPRTSPASASPRLVYTPRPGADYQPPEMAVGTEVIYQEFTSRDLDGIHRFPDLGMSVGVSTPVGGRVMRVVDLSVSA